MSTPPARAKPRSSRRGAQQGTTSRWRSCCGGHHAQEGEGCAAEVRGAARDSSRRCAAGQEH
eukprot:2207833-Pleurochrysis_carterae.AAC.1